MRFALPSSASALARPRSLGSCLRVQHRHTINFTEHPLANPPSRKIKMTRFPTPPPNWGPMARARPGYAGAGAAMLGRWSNISLTPNPYSSPLPPPP